MSALVPVMFFFIVFLCFQGASLSWDWRISVLSSSLVCGTLVTAITEFLSFFRLINFSGILGMWIISVVLSMIFLARFLDGLKSLKGKPFPAEISRFELSLLVGLLVIVTVVGIIALVSPPNNWDSMTYHLSRVSHWIQNMSVAHYPTHVFRQLHQNPWAEFAIMNFQVLSGGDRFANLIQWFSMIGTILGVSFLARELGAGLTGQIFASVFAATVPMAILQGSSTQTDFAVSFWLVCFTSFAILLRKNGRPLYALATGAGLGLAILTKATAYLFAAPFMVWFCLSFITSGHSRKVGLIGIIVTTTCLMNLGHYSRNFDLFGNPLGPMQEGGPEYKYSNNIFSISSVASNVIRNVGIQIGTINVLNNIFEDWICRFHELIGIDANDIRTTWIGTKFHVPGLSSHEDGAINPMHFFLIMVLTPIFLLRRGDPDSRNYCICVVGGLVLFSFYLKWTPWHNRLHLPLFMLWSPLAGLILGRSQNSGLSNSVVVMMMLGALPWVFFNSSRPILGGAGIMTSERIELYFRNRPSLAGPYIRAVEFLSKAECSEIGLVFGGDDIWEYPFWVLMGEFGQHRVRFEHVNLKNISGVKYNEAPFNNFTPDGVVAISDDPSGEIEIKGVTYVQKWFAAPIRVFMRK